jgi:phosphatidylglycerophosphate synthase
VIDRRAQTLLAPLFAALVRPLARRGVSADALTVLGCIVGLLAAAAIVWGHFVAALALMLASRLLDGLDGTLARLTRPTARGAFLDIALDFVFYAAIPLAFALHDPAANALAAAPLLAAFVLTATSFLAFAVLSEKHALDATAAPRGGVAKGFVFLGGLTEAGETLLCFVLMCLLPQHFAPIALGFALLCLVTWGTRMAAGWRRFGAL